MATGTTNSARNQVLLQLASDHKNERVIPQSTTSIYNSNCFNDRVMREKLPKEVYKRLRAIIRRGEKLDMAIADTVAHAMKEWALSKGATHFTHWFQPQTGLTAEKHDAFIEVTEEGEIMERFRGEQLAQGEPDASSFPSGGMRTTFEARGYTMWDPSSPAFIIEGPRSNILCIPSVFISYTGDALDKKTPLLRSIESLSRASLRVMRIFGNTTATRVITTAGIEQEYFLIDKAFFNLRPDLRITGRTLIGAEPPKGQQMEDHYFGSIKERVLAFMQDVEFELYKLGVPIKTRHNEVAPHQFEMAPIFSEVNVATDRNHLTMEVMKKVANRHGLAVLLHEKPFAGVNGSGKHNNWSIADSDGNNLLDPGKTPEENLQFLVFLTAVLRAVYYYGDLLRASITSANNDHRLGANEAPPAIMSVFLGTQLSAILDSIKSGKSAKVTAQNIIELGIANLPPVLRDYTDRNRTSPFAFTGNKFEFRAIGSSASVSLPNVVINAAVADSLDVLAAEIEKELTRQEDLKTAVMHVLRKHIRETDPIRFDGNNYSKEWEQEAARRNLPNIKNTAYALDALVAPKNVEMLVRQKAFSLSEIESRYLTKLEQYVKTLEIETDTLANMVDIWVVPAAVAYQERLIKVVRGLIDLADLTPGLSHKSELELLTTVSAAVETIRARREELMQALFKSEGIEDLSKKAKFIADHVVPLMIEVRKPADELEHLVADDLWPLPRYSEMLFMM